MKLGIMLVLLCCFVLMGCNPRLHETRTTFRYGEVTTDRNDQSELNRPWAQSGDAWWIEQQVVVRYGK